MPSTGSRRRSALGLLLLLSITLTFSTPENRITVLELTVLAAATLAGLGLFVRTLTRRRIR